MSITRSLLLLMRASSCSTSFSSGRGVVSIAAYRKPVTYTVRLRQGYEGELAVWVEGVADDPRSRQAVAEALRRAADMVEQSADEE